MWLSQLSRKAEVFLGKKTLNLVGEPEDKSLLKDSKVNSLRVLQKLKQVRF